MKKHFLTLFFASALILTGCSVFGKASEVDYNNTVVDDINTASAVIEETATLYNDTIPDVVSEKDNIDTSAMQSAYDDSVSSLEAVAGLLSLESRNIEQQNAVRTGVETYQSAAEQYLETYQTMLNYYGDGTYQQDISQVQSIDENLHTSYTTFIQANNDLVDTLESFVSSADTEIE